MRTMLQKDGYGYDDDRHTDVPSDSHHNPYNCEDLANWLDIDLGTILDF